MKREGEKASESCFPLKQRNQRGIPLFTDTKRNKKDSERISAIHMVKSQVDFRIFRTVRRNDVRDNIIVERIRCKTRIIKEAFKPSSVGRRKDKRKIIF